MANKCDLCKSFVKKDATYVVQWGPASNQKVYVCDDHLMDALQGISAIEFFIVKIQKVEDDGS